MAVLLYLLIAETAKMLLRSRCIQIMQLISLKSTNYIVGLADISVSTVSALLQPEFKPSSIHHNSTRSLLLSLYISADTLLLKYSYFTQLLPPSKARTLLFNKSHSVDMEVCFGRSYDGDTFVSTEHLAMTFPEKKSTLIF